MRFVTWSDLHSEHNGFIKGLERAEGDVLILAGDILEVAHLDDGPHSYLTLETCAFARHLITNVFPRYRRVIYVFGNHEHYNFLITQSHRVAGLWFEENGAQNLELLEDAWCVVDNVVIYGCTLWSDLSDDYSRHVVEHGMPDYRHIKLFERAAVPDIPLEQRITHNAFGSITAAYTHNLHQRSISKLEAFLAHRRNTQDLADKKLIIVTHHAPSLRSNIQAHEYRPMGAGYASPLDGLIGRHSEICVWVHGHTHRSMRYRIGATRIITNQLGYAEEALKTFNVTGGFNIR